MRRTSAAASAYPSLPEPERLTFIVGDIHGSLGQLTQIIADLERYRDGREADFVFVGDYVDRGPESVGVLHRLHEFSTAGAPFVTCLMGNHETMLLKGLADPDAHFRKWLAMGGDAMLVALGLPLTPPADPDIWARDCVKQLSEAIGDRTLRWLRSLPMLWLSGDVAAAHAYTDVTRPPDQQTARTLLWARPPRRQVARPDGIWVVHGHTVVAAPKIDACHIAIDTGTANGGPLTAVILGDGEPKFLST